MQEAVGMSLLEIQGADPVMQEIRGWVERREKPDRDEAAWKSGTHLSYRGVFECLRINDEGLLVYCNPADDQERVCLPEGRF